MAECFVGSGNGGSLKKLCDCTVTTSSTELNVWFPYSALAGQTPSRLLLSVKGKYTQSGAVRPIVLDFAFVAKTESALIVNNMYYNGVYTWDNWESTYGVMYGQQAYAHRDDASQRWRIVFQSPGTNPDWGTFVLTSAELFLLGAHKAF